MISGQIEADVLGGSRMELTFRLHTFVYLFLLLWLPPWFLVPLGGLVAAATGKPEGLGLFFLPVVVALLAAVFHWAFSSEAGKAIAVLGGLVQAEPIRA